MKYVIFRTTDWDLKCKPCESAELYKSRLKSWDDEEDRKFIYSVELNTIDDVTALIKEVGKIIIHMESAHEHYKFEDFIHEDDWLGVIEIYDDYRE